MQEQRVTADGTTYNLPRPFLVIATQNPIEYEGTFPLPEAQLDRFLMRLTMGYPSYEDERALLTHLRHDHPINQLEPVIEAPALVEYTHKIQDTFVDDTLAGLHHQLITATRAHPDLSLGASPRASLALYKASQALAALRGRDHVIPEDIQFLIPSILTHRLLMSPEAELRGRTPQGVLSDLMTQVPLNLGKIES